MLYNLLLLGGIFSAATLINVSFRLWQKKLQPTGTIKVVLCALVVITGASFIFASSIEYGIVYATLAVSTLAWLLIAKENGKQFLAEPKSKTVTTANKAHWTWIGPGLKIVVCFLLSCAASLAIALLLLKLPSTKATALVLAGFLMPITWASFMAWSLASHKPWLPGLAMFLLVFFVGTTELTL